MFLCVEGEREALASPAGEGRSFMSKWDTRLLCRRWRGRWAARVGRFFAKPEPLCVQATVFCCPGRRVRGGQWSSVLALKRAIVCGRWREKLSLGMRRSCAVIERGVRQPFCPERSKCCALGVPRYRSPRERRGLNKKSGALAPLRRVRR